MGEIVVSLVAEFCARLRPFFGQPRPISRSSRRIGSNMVRVRPTSGRRLANATSVKFGTDVANVWQLRSKFDQRGPNFDQTWVSSAELGPIAARVRPDLDSLERFRSNLGRLWPTGQDFGQSWASLAKLGPTAANFGPDLATLWLCRSNLGRCWPMSSKFGPDAAKLWRCRSKLDQISPTSAPFWVTSAEFGPMTAMGEKRCHPKSFNDCRGLKAVLRWQSMSVARHMSKWKANVRPNLGHLWPTIGQLWAMFGLEQSPRSAQKRGAFRARLRGRA